MLQTDHWPYNHMKTFHFIRTEAFWHILCNGMGQAEHMQCTSRRHPAVYWGRGGSISQNESCQRRNKMRAHKTIIWTVAIVTVVTFAMAPAADAFVPPIVAAVSLAAAFGIGGLIAEEVVEQNRQENPVDSRRLENQQRPTESASTAAAPAAVR
jgi:cobalamin biosynthesis protein CobD/CbiB